MKNQIQILSRTLAGGALLLTLILPVAAQPGQHGPGDGRGGPPRDGMRGGGGSHRGPRAKGELNRLWHNISAWEGTPLALSKAQSARVVSLVVPISKQKTLDDATAISLAGKIEASLTPAQRAQIAQNHPRGQWGNRPPGGSLGGPPNGQPPRDGHSGQGGGPRDFGSPGAGNGRGLRPNGAPRMDRAEFEKIRPFMDALNPFYPPTGYAGFKVLPAEFAKDIAKRYGERRTLLETLSKRARGR